MTEENEQRMERLFHDHYEQMYRFAFALLHDNEEARDVVSEKNACINLIARKKRDERLKRLLPLSEEKLTEEEPSRLEERWQAAVDCIDHDLTDQTASVIRLCYREGMSYKDTAKLTEEEPSRLEERWQAAVDCIDHDLTDQTASVIRLCYREGMSYKDTAEELGISVSAVNKHIVKGLRTLREKLKGKQ